MTHRPDPERIIKECEWAIARIEDYGSTTMMSKSFFADVAKLLKEQKAVEPQMQPSAKGYIYTCGACGWWLFEVRDTVHFDDRKRIRFCSSCGKMVKWE